MGFRGKQIALLTLVAGAVALATSLANVASLARVAVNETGTRAKVLADALYHQASRVIRQHQPEELAEVLASDPALTNYADGVVGYSATTLYLAITDDKGVALLHSNPAFKGRALRAAESLDSFASQNPFRQLWALSQGHRVLEVAIPFDVDGQPFGAVHVAISTLLLKEQIAGALTTNVLLATAVVLVTFLASFYFANWILAPIEILRRELGRIDPGQGEPPLDLQNEADVNRVAEFFASMSRRLDETRSSREEGSAWLETMVGGLSDAVLVVGVDGRVMSLNPAAEALLERSRADLVGEDLFELLAEEHPISVLVRKALESGESVGPSNSKLGSDDKEAQYSLTAQVLKEGDRSIGVMVSARDMQKLSRLGSHLSYSQKLTALGRLTGGVAHEIKNPLNAMVIHVAVLRQKLAEAEPDTTASLDTLEQEIRRLDRVIQGFLKFTRPEELQLTAVHLAGLLAEVVRLISAEAEESGIKIETDLPELLPPVYGDRELLQQAFLNLLRNACEAMPDGGRVRIVGSRVEDGIEILVEDEGQGIAPDMLDRIFDLYITTKEKGSGIGLSMVYRIVQLHDGDIRVESRPGEGATFRVRLREVPM